MRSGEIKVDALTTFQHVQDTADNKLKYSSVRWSFYERSVVNLVVQNSWRLQQQRETQRTVHWLRPYRHTTTTIRTWEIIDKTDNDSVG